MRTLITLFEENVKKYSSFPLLYEKKTDNYKSATYSEIHAKVVDFAAGLIASGIEKDDRIALLSEGCNNWVVGELGILYAGATNVPLSVKLNEQEILFRLKHSEAKMIIVSKQQYKKLKNISDNLPAYMSVVVLEMPPDTTVKEILFDDIIAKGSIYLQKNRAEFEKRMSSVKEDDYANICYTSGTTADPKGAILTHRNYTSNIEKAREHMKVDSSFKTLLILPWDHSFGHTGGIYALISSGGSLASIQTGTTPMDTLKNIPTNIREIKPTLLLSVPALAKNFKKNIEKGINEKGKIVQFLFNTGLKIGYAYNGLGNDKGKGLKVFIKPLYKLVDTIILKKIREGFGGKLLFFVGGGAYLDIKLQKFFYAIGIPMLQGYGLTEASPIISANSIDNHKLGSSGRVLPGIIVKIRDENGNELPIGEMGEITALGENIMKGYWKNEEATKEMLRNGWLHTGDLGYFDKEGFLYVQGRFKSLLISDDGEKYSPESIEEAYMNNSGFIEQCVLYNNQKPYTIALLYPNISAVMAWMKTEGYDASEDTTLKAVLKKIESELNKYRTGNEYDNMFPQRWLPASVYILCDGFTEQNGLLNSTLKIVRPKIFERYKEEIEFCYTPESKDITNKRNIESIKIFFE